MEQNALDAEIAASLKRQVNKTIRKKELLNTVPFFLPPDRSRFKSYRSLSYNDFKKNSH